MRKKRVYSPWKLILILLKLLDLNYLEILEESMMFVKHLILNVD